eukprot:COSAG01_NODE_508_length_16107_cov_120.001187_15_plen_207_part_00
MDVLGFGGHCPKVSGTSAIRVPPCPTSPAYLQLYKIDYYTCSQLYVRRTTLCTGRKGRPCTSLLSICFAYSYGMRLVCPRLWVASLSCVDVQAYVVPLVGEMMFSIITHEAMLGTLSDFFAKTSHVVLGMRMRTICSNHRTSGLTRAEKVTKGKHRKHALVRQQLWYLDHSSPEEFREKYPNHAAATRGDAALATWQWYHSGAQGM